MKENFYIVQSGHIKRKENTVYFENENVRKTIPIHKVSSIYCLGEISLNSKLLTYLSQKNIVVHFFNYYGYYTGSFYPREYLLSGSLLVNQVEHYLNPEKRLYIASELVGGTLFNISRILLHYKKHGKDVSKEIKTIDKLSLKIGNVSSITNLMQLEGEAWKHYYNSFSIVLREEFEFKRRVKRPPDNEINCLISFMNSLLYTAILTEIYHTQLNPTISYLHEPFERRFSLALDLSEMFKPLIVGRSLFKLVNKRIIKEHHFRKDLKGCLLNDDGKRIVLKEFDERLGKTVQHVTLNRKVSYRQLFRLEGYKLIKHLLGDSQYSAFKIWW